MIKRSWLAFLPLIIFALIVVAFGVALRHSGTEAPKFAQHVNEPAPVTELPILDSSQARFATKDWRGHAYLVNFFASWCVPCRSEHAALMELAITSGLPIIGIAYKDKPETVASFLEKGGNPFRTVAEDRGGRTGIDWGITGVPETFLIDAEGVIRFHAVGPLTDDIINRELLPIWSEVKG